MKKLTVLLAALLVSSTMFAQTCIDDAWQCLKQNQAPKAKKFIESCMAAYPDNAQVWLMKANVYVHLYRLDEQKIKQDPNYTPRYPDALSVANEAFVKALQLDPQVQPKMGMLSAQDGQKLCAEPFYKMASAALEKGDFQKAIENFTIAAKNYELAKASQNAALAYIQIGRIYKDEMKDLEKAVPFFVKSINAKKDFLPSHCDLIFAYLDLKDTVKCGEAVSKALKSLSENNQKEVAFLTALMGYYSMVAQEENLFKACDTAVALYPEDVDVIADCANYLSNYKAFSKAEAILTPAIEKKPNEFRLNEQMGYRFYEEMQSLEEQAAQMIKDKKYNEAIALRESPEMKNVVQKGYEWAQKAYNIDSDRLDNNLHLRQLMVKLGMTVPQELNDKINARMHN